MKVKSLEKENFINILNDLNVPKEMDVDFLYDIYDSVCGAIEDVSNLNELTNFTPVNHVVLILYVLNETSYSFLSKSVEERKKAIEDEMFFQQLASVVADKYITNEQLNYKSPAFLNRFNPPISTIELYLNFCLRSLSVYKNPNDQAGTLIHDMLEKAFKMSQCIVKLLIDGFETEAFSTWRTLHENECIILCLMKYPNELFPVYFKHIKYALAYRGQIPSKDETDKVFEQIKSEMREHDLKSKDMKKYIEYGYLFSVPNLSLYEDFKLNFRDGVEKIAGLASYSKAYETASEITHSSPLLLYSRRDYFFSITILNLYESFFRLEGVFKQFYDSYMNEIEKEKYLTLRNVYMNQLTFLYHNLKDNFLKKFINVEK